MVMDSIAGGDKKLRIVVFSHTACTRHRTSICRRDHSGNIITNNRLAETGGQLTISNIGDCVGKRRIGADHIVFVVSPINKFTTIERNSSEFNLGTYSIGCFMLAQIGQGIHIYSTSGSRVSRDEHIRCLSTDFRLCINNEHQEQRCHNDWHGLQISGNSSFIHNN